MKPGTPTLPIVFAAGMLAAAYPSLAGTEFPISTTTAGNQGSPAVAIGGAGSSVVVWQSGTGDGADVFGQRYDAAGSPVGGEFPVNTYTTDRQVSPAVAVDGTGNFVVVWQSENGQDGDDDGVFGRRYDSAGLPLGGEFQVNTYTTGHQIQPSVAADGVGNFVVAWASANQDGSSYGVFARRYDGAGLPLGGEFQVNTYTTSRQILPELATDGAGNFVVAWMSESQDGDGGGIFGRRYDSAGVPLGGEFQVNTQTTSDQYAPDVAAHGTGSFVVVWARYAFLQSEIFGRRYDSAGLPLGGEFQVNTYTTNVQGSPAAAVDATGDITVVWQSHSGQDGSDDGVFGQRYDGAGMPLGGEFQVNGHTAMPQRAPAVAADGAANFVVAWESADQDGSGLGVFGQRNKPDRVLRGDRVLVRDRGDEKDRAIVVVGKEGDTDIGTSLDGDPTVVGATLRVIATGGTDSDETYALDASGWKSLGSVGFKYSGPTGGDGDPVRRVILKRTGGGTAQLKLILAGNIGTQSLDVVPPNPGDEARVVLQIGNGGGTYCVTLGIAFGSIEGPDTADVWKLSRATAEPNCPVP